ncbi:MAG: hypothetical protein VYA84_20455 [Planctomycetota bacterium]|nr:hypothetical protein [Planctomycetota bacterium]
MDRCVAESVVAFLASPVVQPASVVSLLGVALDDRLRRRVAIAAQLILLFRVTFSHLYPLGNMFDG